MITGFLVFVVAWMIHPFIFIPAIAIGLVSRRWTWVALSALVYTVLFVMIQLGPNTPHVFWGTTLVSVGLWATLAFRGKQLWQGR